MNKSLDTKMKICSNWYNAFMYTKVHVKVFLHVLCRRAQLQYRRTLKAVLLLENTAKPPTVVHRAIYKINTWFTVILANIETYQVHCRELEQELTLQGK